MSTQLQRINIGLRHRIRSLAGDVSVGEIDYYFGRLDKNSWCGPFNGQANRHAIYRAIVELQNPRLVVETGTYRGTTTEALAKTGALVVTIEGHPRNYGFARARLRFVPNVNVRQGDSREQLRALFREMEGSRKAGSVFAYLDAHWNTDLPLKEELDIVFDWDPDAIAMIDDFCVPDDAGYGYDDYGPEAVLNAQYIEPIVRRHGLVSLYPTLHSSKETGVRRGSVVITSQRWKRALLATGLLREIKSG